MVSAVDSPVLNWSGHFLIAMPGMEDPGFARSVVYICEHTERGALGLCNNKPLGLTLSELFEQIKLPLKRDDLHDLPVCWGGPLQPERGFVLHTQPQTAQEDATGDTAPSDTARWHYASSLLTADGLQMTTSRDILEALSEGGGPAPLFAALGQASWDQGQLEKEMRNNSWLTVPANHALIFDTPLDMRYDRAIRLLGVTPGSLTVQAGTA
jgi:putative transcriptional regulator